MLFHLKKKILVAIAMVIGLVLISCSSQLYKPVIEDEAFAQTKWAGVHLTELEKGRSLYVENCSSCHYLYYPQQYNAVQWDSLVSKMKVKGEIADSTAGYILKYLVVASRHQAAKQL